MSFDTYYAPCAVIDYYAEDVSTSPCGYSLEELVPVAFESMSNYNIGATHEIPRDWTETYGSGDCIRSKLPFNLSGSACQSVLFENSFDLKRDLSGRYAELLPGGVVRFQNGDKLYWTPEHGNDQGNPSQRSYVNQPPRNDSSGTTRSGDGPFKCQHCGRSFRKRSHLGTHLHTHDEANFCCDVCPQRFRLEFQLRRHVRMHSVENPQVCPLCGNIFKKRRYLARHIKTHAANKRTFACNICGKQFRYKMHLAEHQITHPVVKLQGEEDQQWKKSLDELFQSLGNETPIVESGDLLQLCPNMKDSAATTSFSSTTTGGVLKQILPPSCLEYDSSSIFNSESAIHVTSPPSGFEMALPLDGHTMTSESLAESPGSIVWFTSLLCPEQLEEEDQATFNSFVVPNEHQEYILAAL